MLAANSVEEVKNVEEAILSILSGNVVIIQILLKGLFL